MHRKVGRYVGRQRRKGAADGAAAHGCVAASVAGEWPARPAATSSPKAKLMRTELLETNGQS